MTRTAKYLNCEVMSDTFHSSGPGVLMTVEDIRVLPDETLIDILRQGCLLAEWVAAEARADYIIDSKQPYDSVSTDLVILRKGNVYSDHVQQAINIVTVWHKKEVRAARVSERNKVAAKYSDLFLALGRRDGFACQHCGDACGDMQIDHIVPIVKGGVSELDNLQLLCPGCNNRKGAS